MNKLYLFLFLFFINQINFAQNGKNIFNKDVLHEIKIYNDLPGFWSKMSEDHFNNIFVEPDSGTYFKSDIIIDGTQVKSVGIRLKGFSSFFSGNEFKKSIKVDLNEFVDSLKYDGITKLNINNGTGDPSMQRDYICYSLFRRLGRPAPRVSYAKIFINDTYWGLYTIVEQVDKEFLKPNYSDSKGDLYKSVNFTDLEFKGFDKELYPEFEKKTNENTDWNNLFSLLENIQENDLEGINAIFDINGFLNTLAIDLVFNNWDNFAFHGRNFYLYEENETKKFNWIPWDYNLAMGGIFFASNSVLLPSDTVCTYRGYVVKNYLSDSINYKLLNTPNMPQDITYAWEYNGMQYETPDITVFPSPDDYDLTLNLEYMDGSMPCSLEMTEYVYFEDNLDFCNFENNPHDRDDEVAKIILSNNYNCCMEWDEKCEDQYLKLKSTGLLFFNIDNYDKVLDTLQVALVTPLLQNAEYKDLYLAHLCNIYENHFYTDTLLKDMNFINSLIEGPLLEDKNYLFNPYLFKYDISEGNKTSGIPSLFEFINQRREQLKEKFENENIDCSLYKKEKIGWHEVVINEVKASSSKVNLEVDQNNEAEDWIELYNNSNTKLNLTSMYLSNTKNQLMKWSFQPGQSIDAHQYYIVWCDKEVSDGFNHANFSLAKDSDQIYLSDGYTIIDSVSFVDAKDNRSYSRIPNGIGNFVTSEITFKTVNDPLSLTDLNAITQLKVFPSLADHVISIAVPNEMINQEVEIVSSQGMVVDKFKLNNAIHDVDIRDLNPSKYFLVNSKKKIVGFFIKI